MNAHGDSGRIAGYYDRLVDKYGHAPEACDAASIDSLTVRYNAISEVLDMSGKSVLEVGCGFGDLGAFIRKRYADVKYTGIDLSPRMIEEGRKANPGLELRCMDVLDMSAGERYDVVVAQGIFYLLEGDAEQKMTTLIEKMYSLARLAVSFSAISSWGRGQSSSEFRVNPSALLESCRKLTSSVVLRHDYHPGDVTMYLYRPVTTPEGVNVNQ